MKEVIDKIQLKNAVRLVVGGFLFDGADVNEIPALLHEIANDYQDSIQKSKV